MLGRFYLGTDLILPSTQHTWSVREHAGQTVPVQDSVFMAGE